MRSAYSSLKIVRYITDDMTQRYESQDLWKMPWPVEAKTRRDQRVNDDATNIGKTSSEIIYLRVGSRHERYHAKIKPGHSSCAERFGGQLHAEFFADLRDLRSSALK